MVYSQLVQRIEPVFHETEISLISTYLTRYYYFSFRLQTYLLKEELQQNLFFFLV